MPDPSESGFIVVECQTPPNQNNKHVCVPKSWVRCKMSETRVAIAYPTEDEARIATRIKNKEPADDLWQYYIGDIKYEAESYEDAVVGFLQTVRGESSKETEEKNTKNEPVAEPKNSLKVRIVVPKPKPKTEKKKKSEKKLLKKHLKEHSKNKKTKHKHAEQVSLKENIPDAGYITGIASSPDSANDQVTTELSSPFVPNSNCQSNYVKQLTENLNNNNKSDLFEKSLETLAGLMEKEIDFTKANFSPNDVQLLMDAQMKTNGIFKFIRQVMLSVKKMYVEAHETKQTLEYIVSKYNIQRPPATVTGEKENDKNYEQNGNTLQEETLQDEMEPEADDEMEHETNAYEQNDNTLNINEESLLEEIDHKSDSEVFTDDESLTYEEFTAAPLPDKTKHNTNDNKNKNTSWTLKYLHPRKGVVPLGARDSGVYISEKGLENAKQSSKNVKTFARLLYKEVFTEEALQTCSMTGRKPCFGRNVDVIRPPLHYHARTVIFAYAMKYGQDVGWEVIKPNELQQTLRQMLQNNRKDRIRGRLSRE